MSDLSEALGTAAEGGMLAHAAEPGTGKTGPGQTGPGQTGSVCLNCGTGLIGPHCHACGQKGVVHRTIGAFLHDLVHGALHFEGKIWRTLPLLVLRPGELTRRYIDGERARFVSPMALFLFSVFLMFAVFQAVGLTTPVEFEVSVVAGEQIAEEKAALERERAGLEAARNALPQGDPQRRELAARIAQVDQSLADLRRASAFVALDASDQEDLPLTGLRAIDEGIFKKWRANPGLMLYKLQTNFYKFSWLLIPLSVPFVWLLFAWRRRFNGYDHAVFVTYSLAFMSLLFILLSIVGMSGLIGGWAFAALVLIPPVHLYKQLRGTYGLGRISAVWRLLALSLFIWIVLILFLQLLLLLGGV